MALLVLREDVLFNLSLFKEGSVLYPDKWEKTKEQTAALCANIMHDDSITTYELAIASATKHGCVMDLQLPFNQVKALMLVNFFLAKRQTERLLLRQTSTRNITSNAPPTVESFRHNIIRMLIALFPPKTKLPSSKLSIVSLVQLVSTEINKLENSKNSSNDISPLLIDGTSMSEGERDTVRIVMKDMNTEYLLRRRMMLKRLDVTLQSFLWSSKARGQENDIIAAIRPLVAQLHALVNFEVTETELFSQTKNLTAVQYLPVCEKRGRGSVKNVLIGSVPDRGGRTQDIRPRDLMPSWSKRRSGGGGGGGGGHGGGRGRARGRGGKAGRGGKGGGGRGKKKGNRK